MNRKPDIKLAKRIINWDSKTKINDGLDITIKEFLKN